MAVVLIPIPARDFDPTEVAVTWQVLSGAGHEVVFATPSGHPGEADDLMVTGQGLDPWGMVPILRRVTVVGRVLRADRRARSAYADLVEDARVPLAPPLGRGAPVRLRRPRAAGRSPGPGYPRLPRERRGAEDGGRCVRGA